VIITLERYFKIVHAIAHRKYYRNWMTNVGVALPWISGFCAYFIPTVVTVKRVPGRCLTTGYLGAWPTRGGKQVWRYVMIYTVFQKKRGVTLFVVTSSFTVGNRKELSVGPTLNAIFLTSS